ncbi:MAG TPA: GNAT family N-acetyltransferase [Ginsengibacter sp.]
MNIKIEKLNHHDIQKFTELINVFEAVFKMNHFKIPDEIYLQELLRKDDFFVFVALQNNKVIGGLTSYIMQQYYSKLPLVYIYDLAIKTEFQRQGIGKMLITVNNSYCKSIGIEEVMVDADEVDDYAIKFYQSTGAIGKKVLHFDYFLIDK